MRSFQKKIASYLDRQGMRAATGRRTQRFGSGKVAFRKGDALVLVSGANGMQYIYVEGSEAAHIAPGKGLLYSYDSWEEAERYVEETGAR